MSKAKRHTKASDIAAVPPKGSALGDPSENRVNNGTVEDSYDYHGHRPFLSNGSPYGDAIYLYEMGRYLHDMGF